MKYSGHFLRPAQEGSTKAMRQAIFTIEIESTHHSTWQGVLIHQGESHPFASELELLRLMDSLLPGPPTRAS